MRRIELLVAAVCILLLVAEGSLYADQKEFKLGVLNSLTGTFAAAGRLTISKGK